MSPSSHDRNSLRGWLSQLTDDFRTHERPWWPLTRGGYYAYLGLWHSVTSRWPVGTNVFEREWDALVILDACRLDAMRAVAPEYDFIDGVDGIWSVGSTSHEWVAKTFTEEWQDEISETGYITANGYLSHTSKNDVYPPSGGTAPLCWPKWNVVDAEDFALVDYVWADGGDDRIPTVPPHEMTNRAIETARSGVCERLIVHYMQPHSPYVADAVENREIRPDAEEHVELFRTMMSDERGREGAWQKYLDNLRFVLDEVELLLSNLDADTVVISADHGHLLGEFGLSIHPDGFPLPVVKKVPWIETTATDEQTLEPSVERSAPELEVEDYLRELGYVV